MQTSTSLVNRTPFVSFLDNPTQAETAGSSGASFPETVASPTARLTVFPLEQNRVHLLRGPLLVFYLLMLLLYLVRDWITFFFEKNHSLWLLENAPCFVVEGSCSTSVLFLTRFLDLFWHNRKATTLSCIAIHIVRWNFPSKALVLILCTRNEQCYRCYSLNIIVLVVIYWKFYEYTEEKRINSAPGGFVLPMLVNVKKESREIYSWNVTCNIAMESITRKTAKTVRTT